MVEADNIINKLKEAGLTGRGGACFPTWKKWQMVIDERDTPKYVVCNVSEGEPGVHKDEFLLTHKLDDVLAGIAIAVRTIQAEKAFIYLRSDLYGTFHEEIKKRTRGFVLECIKEEGGYISGEESTLISVIEGKNAQPKIRPPFPTKKGVFGKPTLVNNCETLYDAARIVAGTYHHTRLYTIGGKVAHKGVYELGDQLTVEEILKETGNTPAFDFFVQVGGGASGPILLAHELNTPVPGSGAIIVFEKEGLDPYLLLRSWIDFFMRQNCDKCVPCREGLLRIAEMLQKKKLDTQTLDDLLFTLKQTSFCPLGKSVPIPLTTFIEKILYEQKGR